MTKTKLRRSSGLSRQIRPITTCGAKCKRPGCRKVASVIADFQTAGKGQVGNSWESEAGKNLMFSILLYPDFLPANRQFLISQIASLSVKETLEKYTDSVTVKWPNDIYWKDRKICGMLIERSVRAASLLFCSRYRA